ncbi:IclR family transcriptional regulator [Streptomyces odontomachi]|uniref:IclR family transcriptional regulator n=1 Tax=Streptomyces odontomachi TaxID=2944940 RepID=UPI00210B63D1|nr:IclR family transcriptional regulator [Streptomyces sp. ODS25]
MVPPPPPRSQAGSGESPGSSGATIKSADRVLAIFDLLAEKGTVRFVDVVNALGLPRSSAHGLLATMTARNYLEFDEASRHYALGLRAWQLGQSYAGHGDLEARARPLMDELAKTSGETVQLARLDGIFNVYVAIAESPQPMQLVSHVGSRLHAHATGVGKVLLAALDPAEARRRLAAQPLPRLTERTVTDVDTLMDVLAQVRASGYAQDHEEYVAGCHCVAVPVRDRQGGTLAALSLSTPTFRCDEQRAAEQLQLLRALVDRLERLLGR